MEAHAKLEPTGWSYSKMKIFDNFGARNIIGNAGIERFLKSLSENAANTPGAIQEINELAQEVTLLLTNSNNILSSLGKLGEEEKVEEGLRVIQIVFDKEVRIDDLVQLTEQSKEWKNIIRAFSLLVKEPPEKTKIISISKSTPLSLMLATIPSISDAIYTVVKAFVELWKTYLEAQEHAIKLEDMKVGVDGKKFELFKTVDEYARKRISEIVDEAANSHKSKKLRDPELQEAKAALLKAGPELYEFITKGGKVDVAKKDSDDPRKIFQLGDNYQKIYKLKDNVQKMIAARVVSKPEPKDELVVSATDKRKRGRPSKKKVDK